jgi:Na+/melibiose symporter-like transporter
MIATTGIFVLISPLVAYWAAPWLALRMGKPKAAMAGLVGRLLLYPVPYILLLNGLWPEVGSWPSLFIYSVFIVLEVIGLVIGGVLMDSMMADVVEDSEVSTYRRSEGLFFAARGFAYKAISAGGIIGAGAIVSLVGLDSVTSAAQVTQELRFNIAIVFLPVYCGLALLAILILSRYRIDRTGHAANLDRLRDRRTAEST